MAISTKRAVVMRHGPTQLFFSKTASLTENLFNAMTFADESNATNFIAESHFRPADPENYEPVPIITTREVVEHGSDGSFEKTTGSIPARRN